MSKLYNHNWINNTTEFSDAEIKTKLIKNKLINLLWDQWIKKIYVNYINELVSIEDITKYLKYLVGKDIISKSDYFLFSWKTWLIWLGIYLISKDIINQKDFLKAMKIQNELKQQMINEKLEWNLETNYKTIWEILVDEWFIDNLKKFHEALDELWIIRIWESVVKDRIISKDKMDSIIKIHEIEKKIAEKYWLKCRKIWEIIVEQTNINKTEMNKILDKKWIKHDKDIFKIDYSN